MHAPAPLSGSDCPRSGPRATDIILPLCVSRPSQTLSPHVVCPSVTAGGATERRHAQKADKIPAEKAHAKWRKGRARPLLPDCLSSRPPPPPPTAAPVSPPRRPPHPEVSAPFRPSPIRARPGRGREARMDCTVGAEDLAARGAPLCPSPCSPVVVGCAGRRCHCVLRRPVGAVVHSTLCVLVPRV